MTDVGRLPRYRRGRPRKVRLAAAVAGALALVVGVGYATELGPFDAGSSSGPDQEATERARAFLDDWAAGRMARAAASTSRPEAAERVLSSFTDGLDISDPTLTPGAATDGPDSTVTVPFTARMPVTGLGTWTYRSSLPLRRQDDGTWRVEWTLSLVHPRLTDTEKFRLEREATAEPRVTDRNGEVLTGESHPALRPVLAQIPDATGAGRPRGAVHLVDRVTGQVVGTEAEFGGKPDDATDRPVTTTLDATWQSAAEEALAAEGEGRDAALVALRVADGEVLAVANAPSTGFNRAVSGTYAPGSTWKIVTSSALLLREAVTPDTVVDCPRYLTVGKRFQNVETSEHRGATFREDFAESCNTAFISLRDQLSDQELGEVAERYFGVGQEWHVGIPSYDGSVPVPGDATEKAAAMIGQGRVQANPLVMASVTATAVSGTFHQPTLVAGQPDTTSTTPLPPRLVAQIRSMMRATVTDGSARMLSDLPGEVGAKTGTAEVAEDVPNNGWLVAHRGDVVVACVVEKGVTGGGSAAPIVRNLLAAVPAD